MFISLSLTAPNSSNSNLIRCTSSTDGLPANNAVNNDHSYSSHVHPVEVNVETTELHQIAPDYARKCSTPRRKYTQTKAKLAMELKHYRNSLRKVRKRYSSYRKKIEKEKKMSLKENLKNKGVNDTMSKFIARQVKLSIQNKKCRRCKQFDKINAYRIFCKSQAAFKLLLTFLPLPSPQTLINFISSRLCVPGVNTSVLNALKDVLHGQNESKRLFALVIDEMAIKPFLTYDRKNDCIVGFEDFGIGVGRSNEVASQALVLMLHTLTSHTKLPLGFILHIMECQHMR